MIQLLSCNNGWILSTFHVDNKSIDDISWLPIDLAMNRTTLFTSSMDPIDFPNWMIHYLTWYPSSIECLNHKS